MTAHFSARAVGKSLESPFSTAFGHSSARFHPFS